MIFIVHTHVYVSAHNAKWAAKVRLFFEMTKFFFEKMQKILRFVRYICIYAIFVVPLQANLTCGSTGLS